MLSLGRKERKQSGGGSLLEIRRDFKLWNTTTSRLFHRKDSREINTLISLSSCLPVYCLGSSLAETTGTGTIDIIHAC